MTQQHQARKRFGQNFLHDHGVISRIVAKIGLQPGQQVLEIGPGQGALTQQLLAAKVDLLAVELDKDLVPLLQQQFADVENFSLRQGDALKLQLHEHYQAPCRVVGNLPYNISTPLIFHLLQQVKYIQDMHFMLQKEVVERMAAAPGSKTYGRLSVMVQYHCEVQHLFDVPPTAFKPAPKVMSSIVRLCPKENHSALCSEALATVVKQAFSQRRKTLGNCLKGLLEKSQFEQLGIDAKRRAESLSNAEFVTIANFYHRCKSGSDE